MLGEPKLKVLLELIKHCSREELIWMNGYIAGIIAKSQKQEEVVVTSKPAVGKITIAYGTETGNSKKLATEFAAKAKKNGINAKLVSLDQYRLNDLSKEEYFFTVISTQGDGEPPAAAKKFYDHIHQNNSQLSKLKYGVLALGDTAYPQFCKVGEDVDSQLNKLGAERLITLLKCDTDYETEADTWFASVLKQLSSGEKQTEVVAPVVARKPSGKKIYSGTILANINLNDRGSNKQTHHIEIAAEDLHYQPGDSIGIVPHNSESLVQKILANCCCDKVKKHNYRNEELTVSELMTKKLNISFLPDRVVKKYAAIVQQEIPDTKISFGDLLRVYPVKDAAQFDEVLQVLEPITPRLYSIASSPEAHSGEVHITVARDKFWVNDEIKYGLCSDCLSQWPVDTTIDFYVHHNDQFRLPGDDQDVIMIGPGTGIAPFRSFLAHRDATGASGRNWLFFGDQHFVTDFLYQSEIQAWHDTGLLTRANVAFSRDQQQKVYVQHKMKKHAADFFNWIESGAYIYLCGAKEPMSVDVENTILEIIQYEGNKSKEQAEEYLNVLKEQGRYLKDVY